ncbi:MAG: Ku protein [Solirubrobacterales bacterium]
MRAFWKGHLSFGLVNIPIGLVVATEKQDVKFRYLHKDCNTPVEYRKHCPTCDRDIAQAEIVYGYEYSKGRFVVLTEDDFARVPSETTKSVDILDFVEYQEVDPIYYDKTYYLEPADGGVKAYQLLIHAMKQTGRAAIARIALRTKQSLAIVRVKDELLILETMFYPDEIRSSEALAPTSQIQLHDNEIKMAVNLIENLSTRFEPSRYRNEYREALHEIIEAKAAGEQIELPQPVAAGNVVDLMEALKQSVKLAEASRGKSKAARGKRKRSQTG